MTATWRDCAKAVGLSNRLSEPVGGFALICLCWRKAVSWQRRLRRTETQFEWCAGHHSRTIESATATMTRKAGKGRNSGHGRIQYDPPRRCANELYFMNGILRGPPAQNVANY